MHKLKLLGCLVTLAATAGAQQRSTEDAAGWWGIMLTPVGAFPVLEAPRANDADVGSRFSLLASRWNIPGSSESQYTGGVTYRPHSPEKSRYELTLGFAQPSKFDLDELTAMVGGGMSGSFWQNQSLAVDWKLSAGFGHSRANGGYEYGSFVGQLPLRWTQQMANKSALSAFASAGYGVAGVGDYADAEYGLRPLMSFGAGWTSPDGIGLHLGAQQVMLDLDGASPPWVAGLSLSIRR